MRRGTSYTLMFCAAVCVVCSVFVAGSASLLKERQDDNRVLERQRHVLSVAGLAATRRLPRQEIQRLSAELVEPRLIDLRSGAFVSTAPPGGLATLADPVDGWRVPDNAAGIVRLPRLATVYLARQDGHLQTLILPVHGRGLWSTLQGLLALSASDANTIEGLTFYRHAETPGLGAEVGNPRWTARFVGRQAYDSDGRPAIAVIRGRAGPPKDDPHAVDGISGATITSDSVTALLHFWLGPHGYGPFLAGHLDRGGAS